MCTEFSNCALTPSFLLLFIGRLARKILKIHGKTVSVSCIACMCVVDTPCHVCVVDTPCLVCVWLTRLVLYVCG